MKYDNNNRGALWKNENKKTDKHPNLRGSAEINGVEYWVSGWTSSEGGKKPLVSLSFQLKEDKPAARSATVEDFEDLPF